MDRLIRWTNSLCGLSFCQIVNGSTMCACVCNMHVCVDMMKLFDEIECTRINQIGRWFHRTKRRRRKHEKSGRLERCTANVFVSTHSYCNASSVAQTHYLWAFVPTAHHHCESNVCACYTMWYDVKVQWTHISVCSAIIVMLRAHRYGPNCVLGHTPTKRYALDRLVQKATTIYRRNKHEMRAKKLCCCNSNLKSAKFCVLTSYTKTSIIYTEQ